MNTSAHSVSYLAHFFLQLEKSKIKVVEEIKTHIFW